MMRETLIIMAGLALYVEGGVTPALTYLRQNGLSTAEAMDVLMTWDSYRATVQATGTIP